MLNIHDVQLTEAYDAGAQAFKDCYSLFKNPHLVDSELYLSWRLGFLHEEHEYAGAGGLVSFD